MNIRLYAAQGSNCSERIEWVLHYKALPYQRVEVTNEALSSDYLSINPFGYVPALEIDGYITGESMAIAEWLEELFPNPPLLPTLPFDRAKVRGLCEFINSTIHSAQNRSVLKQWRPDLAEQEKRRSRAQWIHTSLEKLSPQLWQQGPYVMGKPFSLADIFTAVMYRKGLAHGMSAIPAYEEHREFLRMNNLLPEFMHK